METTALKAAAADLQQRIGLREELLAFFYSDRQPEGYQVPGGKQVCLIAALTRARHGETVYCDAEHYGCRGCGHFLGFVPPMPTIDYFVSTGIPGKMEGEHYKQSPELVRQYREECAIAPAPAPYAVFKPVSCLVADERPELLFYFGTPDELSALVTLANFARADDGVICPFGSGCGTLISRALVEARHERPRAILGLFDPSARPCVPADRLSFSAPLAMWAEMFANAPESFLKTETWSKVKQRIASAG
ncbi:MAG: DUF169 domain-containing protein [Armatimonadetes bacterium]|jgi:hypothetical protein|nr:DUF169 domain-containing protein [Armatimonadota bacterium]